MSEHVPEPGGEPEPSGEPAGEAAQAEPEAEWQGPSREEWEATQQFIQASAPFMQELASMGQFQPEYGPQEYQPEPLPEYDPTDPESVERFIAQAVDQRMQTQMAPFTPLLGQIAEQEGLRMASDYLDTLQQEIGEFDRDHALVLSQALMTAGMQGDQALYSAARFVQDFTKSQREAAIDEYKRSLQEAATAPSMPGEGGAVAEGQETPSGRDRYEVVAQNWLSSRNPGMLR